MLVPAVLVADKLAEAWKQMLLAPGGIERTRFYRASHSSSWVYDPPGTSDWSTIARASTRGDQVLGYCGASVEEQTNTVVQLMAWTARRGSRTYLSDLESFADELLSRFNVVRFTLALESPSRPLAESWTKRRGGRVVGTLSCWGRDYRGRLWDAVMYEVPGRAL